MIKLVIVLVAIVASFAAEHRNELVLQDATAVGEFVKSTRPSFNNTAVPASYDLRLLGLLTTDLNQHIPVYW